MQSAKDVKKTTRRIFVSLLMVSNADELNPHGHEEIGTVPIMDKTQNDNINKDLYP